ncbi:MAG: bL28 family ribosomal protein [Bdellovibrionales bacterium]|nr:bL28 family ribosomal protein [Bdellovibrionales bacterium]
MSRCELSGCGPAVKNLVSHSNIKTKSRAFPNVQKRTFYSLTLKRYFQAKVSTRVIRSIDKMGGVDIYLLKQKNENLSPRMLKLKKLLLHRVSK